MNLLVLGGSKFVGRHIVLAFLAAGHQVTVFNRGESPDELPTHIERLHGNRNDAASVTNAFASRSWNVCVDVSGYTPQQVQISTAALQGRVGQYIFISTASVYSDAKVHPITEEASIFAPAPDGKTEVTGETYGPLKVACEQVVMTNFADAYAILRPQLVAGPYDYTARYSYWVDRAARGSPVLAPGNGQDHLQVIDARDLAEFTVKIANSGANDTFNLSGHRLTWAEFLDMLGITNLHWIKAETLASLRLGWNELPLYIPEESEDDGLMNISNTRAVAAGLRLRTPLETAQATREWSQTQDITYALSPEKEAEILAGLE